MGRPRTILPVGRYDAELMGQISLDWPRLDAIVGRETTDDERVRIKAAVDGYAMGRIVTVRAPTKEELGTQIDEVRRAARVLGSLAGTAGSSGRAALRTLMGNRPKPFDWASFSRLIDDFSERLADATKSVAQGDYAKSFHAGEPDDFMGFAASMADRFTELGGAVQAHRNINRPIPPFVKWCVQIQLALPVVLRQHMSSEISLSSELSRCFNRLRQENAAWAVSLGKRG